MVDHVVLSLDHLRKPLYAEGLVDRGLDQQNVCSGCHRVGVLDVERGLKAPSAHVVIGRVVRGDSSRRMNDLERRRRRHVGLLVERRQVARDRRRAVRIDQNDRLALARKACLVERVHVVGLLQLERLIARDPELIFAVGRRRRLCETVRDERVVGRRGRGTDPPCQQCEACSDRADQSRETLRAQMHSFPPCLSRPARRPVDDFARSYAPTAKVQSRPAHNAASGRGRCLAGRRPES